MSRLFEPGPPGRAWRPPPAGWAGDRFDLWPWIPAGATPGAQGKGEKALKEIKRPADAGHDRARGQRADDLELRGPDPDLTPDVEELSGDTPPDARAAPYHPVRDGMRGGHPLDSEAQGARSGGAGVVLEDAELLQESPLSPDSIGEEVADFVALSADENAEEVLEEIGRHTLDKEILAEFEERQRLAYGSDELALKLQHNPLETPEIAADDIDAGWEWAAVGEELPGGSVATPDQDVVDNIGRAVGLTYQDDEPLRGADKVEGRDQDRWELDPASVESDPALAIRLDVDDLDPDDWDGPGLDLDDDDDDWPDEDELDPYDEELDEIDEQLKKEDGFVP